jgi:hypothetical protein
MTGMRLKPGIPGGYATVGLGVADPLGGGGTVRRSHDSEDVAMSTILMRLEKAAAELESKNAGDDELVKLLRGAAAAIVGRDRMLRQVCDAVHGAADLTQLTMKCWVDTLTEEIKPE